MPKTVKIDDELLRELERYADEMGWASFTDAVNEALYDYFDFPENEDEDEEEGEIVD